jgi:DNA replication protein DnaC
LIEKEEECPKCGGTGWATEKRDGREFAVKCNCRKEDMFLLRGERANIPPRFLAAELKNFVPNPGDPSQKKAKKEARRFIDDFPAVTDGLLLQGPTGVGKTRLLCSIATELMKKDPRIDIYYIDWNDLVRQMRSGEDASTRDYEAINELIYKLTTVDLLLFDELGGSKVSQWVDDHIYYLFNRRYNNQKITCCATNFLDNPSADRGESLAGRIGKRIRSRLYEMTRTLEIKGMDYRQQYG